MTKINLIKLLIILLAFVPSGCISDLEFEYPDTPSLPVVNALLNPDSSISVKISKLMVNTELQSFPINNATVIICDKLNNSFVINAIGDGIYELDYAPLVDMSYSLNLDISGFESLIAQTEIPPPYTPISATIGNTWSFYSPPQLLYQIKAYPVFVTLPSVESNHFLILRFMAKRIGRYWTNDSIASYEVIDPPFFDMIELFTSDLILTSFGQDTYYVMQSEHSALETQHQIILWVSEALYWSVGTHSTLGSLMYDSEPFLDIISCSPEFYKYFRTYIINSSERVNPFAEPVEVFSNIENGLGIFAGYSMQRIQLNQR